ncbi:MAG: hypothetical protein B6I37_08675 [Desulfobacteraceae bacterium 4572_35.2]|nr:MAG: hypothetical protein B6I37_08675 [Desulfobacteraceae bacterium 4572_35.2]
MILLSLKLFFLSLIKRFDSLQHIFVSNMRMAIGTHFVCLNSSVFVVSTIKPEANTTTSAQTTPKMVPKIQIFLELGFAGVPLLDIKSPPLQ